MLRHRVAVLLVIAALTGLAGWSISRAVFASSVIRLFFGDNPKYTQYRELADRFGGSDVMVVAFEDEALLTETGLERLARIREQVESFEFIRQVQSLDASPRIRGDEGELIIEAYSETGLDPEVLRKALVEDPLAGGWLVSQDGRATAMLVELTADPDRPIEAVPGMLDDVRQVFLDEGVPQEGLHMAGIVAESSEATNQARFTLTRLFPITMGILALVVFALFLRIWPVFITGGVALVAIIWTFGLAVALDPKINLMMAMVPGMITVVAFSDIIHLYSAFARECQGGLDREAAVLKSGAEVGEACLYTSLTTFVGFASLAFIPTPILRQLGVVLGAGVGIALLLALTLVPIVLSLLPGIRPGMQGESRLSAKLLDAIVDGCARLTQRFPKGVAAFFAVVIMACIAGVSQLEVEASFARRLDPDNRVRKAQDFIQARFAGANFLDVYVSTKDEGGLLDPETFSKIGAYQAALEARSDVDGVVSLVTLLDVLHRQMTEVTQTAGFALPPTREMLAQYLLLFEVSGGEGLERLIDEERQTMRLSVRLDTDGLRALARAGDESKVLADEMLPDQVSVVPTGIAYLLGDWVTFILDGQRRGLGFAIITTTLMMILSLRSLRVGAMSMVPNLLPLLVLGGYVGGVWDVADSDTILVATFAIGIAVDDTIHFLTRLRLESAQTDDVKVALDRTFALTGRAIVQTTIILCLGFSPFAWSDYFSTRIIGTLLPMTLVVALVADLLLVPALVHLRVLRFR